MASGRTPLLGALSCAVLGRRLLVLRRQCDSRIVTGNGIGAFAHPVPGWCFGRRHFCRRGDRLCRLLLRRLLRTSALLLLWFERFERDCVTLGILRQALEKPVRALEVLLPSVRVRAVQTRGLWRRVYRQSVGLRLCQDDHIACSGGCVRATIQSRRDGTRGGLQTLAPLALRFGVCVRRGGDQRRISTRGEGVRDPERFHGHPELEKQLEFLICELHWVDPAQDRPHATQVVDDTVGELPRLRRAIVGACVGANIGGSHGQARGRPRGSHRRRRILALAPAEAPAGGDDDLGEEHAALGAFARAEDGRTPARVENLTLRELAVCVQRGSRGHDGQARAQVAPGERDGAQRRRRRRRAQLIALLHRGAHAHTRGVDQLRGSVLEVAAMHTHAHDAIDELRQVAGRHRGHGTRRSL